MNKVRNKVVTKYEQTFEDDIQSNKVITKK